jgi:hypothetical protein
MQVMYERCAVVDVGKDVSAVAVRLAGDGPDGRQTVKRTFKTFYVVLGEAARWLVSLGVTRVAMEATGIYSMPVYHALLSTGSLTRCWCATPGTSRTAGPQNGPDAEWLAHPLECGLLADSFIPPAEIKAAQDVLRYPAKVAQQRVSEIARLGNVLQDAGSRSTPSPAPSQPSPGGR